MRKISCRDPGSVVSNLDDHVLAMRLRVDRDRIRCMLDRIGENVIDDFHQ